MFRFGVAGYNEEMLCSAGLAQIGQAVTLLAFGPVVIVLLLGYAATIRNRRR